jgi:hypothetical protein
MKIVGILLIIGIVIASGFGAVAMPTSIQNRAPQPNSPTGPAFQDELDQSMTSPDTTPLPIGAVFFNMTHQQNLSAAQSFITSKDVITRVLLLMARNATTTHNCTCDLKENLIGDALATVQVTPDQFHVYDPENATGNLTWVEFNFYGVWVTPGTTYYLVVYTTNATNNVYFCAGNDSNVYQNGSAYYSLDDGHSWQNLTNSDACFQTYGVQETTLSVSVGGTSLLGPWFTIKNTGNHTAVGVASNVTVIGGALGLAHSFSFKYYEDLPQNNQKNLLTPFTLGFGRVKITETVSAINARDQVIHVNATLILFIMIVK